MSAARLLATLTGFPFLLVALFAAWLTPRYVPSGALAEAAASASSPQLARANIVGALNGLCAREWRLDAQRLDGSVSLYSWENDAGLVARTRISCAPDGPCAVSQSALFAWPFPAEVSGKRFPTRLWSCHDRRRIAF